MKYILCNEEKGKCTVPLYGEFGLPAWIKHKSWILIDSVLSLVWSEYVIVINEHSCLLCDKESGFVEQIFMRYYTYSVFFC